MNRQIRRLTFGVIVLYVALFVTLNYWQVDRTTELASKESNTRAAVRQYNKARGPIITADGVVVARSTLSAPGTDVKYQREYPTGDLFAPLVGYYTYGLGSTQLERAQSDVLTGDTTLQEIRAVPGILGQAQDNSGQVLLTLRNDLQATAKRLLGEREGSIVLMRPTTGAVLAMWSYPSFDPNQIAQPNYDDAFAYLTNLQNDERDPLLANAYQQRYMPGSTFKVLTTGAALDAGYLTLDSVFPEEREWVPPLTTDPIENYNGEKCGGPLTVVFAKSCNIPFAQTAIAMGPDLFKERIERWGVGQPIPIDLPRPVASTLGDWTDMKQKLPLLGMRGFGQNEDQMVPLHMAMVAATVANNGAMMKPYVVDATLDHDGNVLKQTEPTIWRYPISASTTATLRDLMVQVATVGTARCCIALDNNISVAAKTGTAQLNASGEPERSHAWIIAFAPADKPQFAVAVMLKGTDAEISSSTGGRLAGPIAKQMLDAALKTEPPDAPETTDPEVADNPTAPDPSAPPTGSSNPTDTTGPTDTAVSEPETGG